MTHVQWNRFKRSINLAFKATVAPEQLITRLSATQGHALTAQQFDWLVSLETDVVQVGEEQYSFGSTCAGLKLFRLVLPVSRDAATPAHTNRQGLPA